MRVQSYTAGRVPGRRTRAQNRIKPQVAVAHACFPKNLERESYPFLSAVWRHVEHLLDLPTLYDLVPKEYRLGSSKEIPLPTLQINRNAQLCYHKDSGDLKGCYPVATFHKYVIHTLGTGGMAVLTVVSHGNYTGGVLVT